MAINCQSYFPLRECHAAVSPPFPLTFSVMAVRQIATAPLVPASAPHALDQAPAATCCAGIFIFNGQAKALNATIGQANGQERLRRVQDLSEQVRRERERAEVLQHGGKWTVRRR